MVLPIIKFPSDIITDLMIKYSVIFSSGILSILLIYSLVFYLLLRRKNYSLYILYIVSVLYLVLTSSEIARKIYWDNSSLFHSINLICSHTLFYISFSIFFMYSLKTEKNFPLIHKFLGYFVMYPIFLLLLSTIDISLSKILIVNLYQLFPVLFIYITIKAMPIDNIKAKGYLKIFLGFLFVILIYGLSLDAELNSQNLFKLLLYIGFIFEIIYYSFAIANKIRKYSNDIKLLERRSVLQDIKFHELLDATFDCFWETSKSGDLIYISNKIYEKIGYKKEEINITKLEDLFSKNAPNELKIQLRAIMGKKNSFKNIEIVSETKTGLFIWFKLNAIVKKDNLGNFKGYIGALIDETSDRHRQYELFMKNNTKSLARMAGAIAHEINNPLAFIFLAIDSIINNDENISGGNNKKIINLLMDIKKKGLKISNIVSKLQGLSMQGSELIKTECKLSSIIDMAVRFCVYEIKSAGVSLDIQIDENEKFVLVKKEEISKALVNLIHNAIEATENSENPWIKISVKCEDDNYISLSIMDNGEVIPIDHRASIFEPFYTTKDFKNIGLGLTQSYQFVIRNSGTLALDINAKNTNFIMKFKGKNN